MKKLILSALLLFTTILFFNPVVAQEAVLHTPGKYLMPMDNASAGLPGKNKEGDLWVVFSDRPGNALYSDKNCKNPSGQKMDFMAPKYVIGETDDAIQVINLEDADARGNLLDGAVGRSLWVKKENMLLWNTCLKTRDVNLPEFKDGIFNKKAMVLNIITGSQQEIRAPEYYSHPRCNRADSINSALVYQINYVYKETPTAYLLADMPQLTNIPKDITSVKGWVLKSQTTAWNHRLAFEVNWDSKAVAERKAKGKKAKIYSSKSASGSTIYEEPSGYYKSRDIGEVDRYPVLDTYNGVSKVGVIGDLRSQEGGTLSSNEFAQIKHVIDSMSASLRNINVIFVVDGTSSMVPYSRSIQNAIKQTMRSLMKSSNNYRFGALLYRDASEGRSNLIHYTKDLTSNVNGVTSLFSRYMTPNFNQCNEDAEEAVFYGMKKAIERFDPPAGESNFIILIGDAGNHSRTQYTDCDGNTADDPTSVAVDEVAELMARKNINLFAYQVNHKVELDQKPYYDAFRTQVEDLMSKVVLKRSTGLSSAQIFDKSKDELIVKSDVGIPGYFKMAPDGGNMHPQILAREISTGLNQVDEKVNHQLDGISEYLNGKLANEHAKELTSFIDKLKNEGLSQSKLDIVFQKNGQVYNTGYAKRFEDGMESPVFQDVLLMSREDLFSIKRSLDRLIPTDDLSLSANQSRSFIVYGWGEILVDILGYFPEVNEAIDTLSLYTLSAILTGWGGKEKYKDIKLLDVIQPDRFPDVMLYEYLIDWCITKGHIQSIYDGQNLLTEDFFGDHMWTIFYEYLYHLTNGGVEDDPDMGRRFAEYFEKYNREYNNFKATFKIPLGTGSGLKHYWIDSRIFPHNASEFGEEDFIEYLYKDYIN